MGNPNNKAIIGVGYKVDKASASEVLNTNKAIDNSFQRTGNDIRKAFSGSEASSSVLNKRLAEGKKNADELAKRLADVRKNAKAAADVDFDNLRAGTTGGRGAGSAREGFDRRETAGERTSAILGALPGGGEIANISGLVADINAAGKAALDAGTGLQTLAVAGGASVIAVAAIALALQNFNQVTEASRANLTAALTAQQAYYDAVATLDEQGARDRIAELQRSLETQQRLAEEARNAADTAFEQLVNTDVGFGVTVGDEVASVFFAVDASAQALVTTANEAESALSATEQEITRLSQGLEAGEFAANNAAAAQTELAAATNLATQSALQSTNNRVNRELEYYRLADNASAESIQQRIDENNERIRLLNQELEVQALLAEHGQDTTQVVSELNEQITALEQDTQRLSGTILSAAQTREAEANAVREAEEAERNRTQTLQQVAQIQNQISADEAAQAQQDLRSQRDFLRQRLYEDIDFQQELAQAQAEFNQRQLDAIKELQALETEAKSETLEAEKEFAEQEIERTQNFEKKLADIRRKSQIEVGEAAGELDAKRVLAALQARDEELKGAVEANTEEAQANAQARDERIAAAQEQLTEQRAELQARLAQERQAFQESQAAAVAAFAERRRREDEARAIQRNDELADRTARRQAQVQQLLELQASLAQEKAVRQGALAQALADTSSFFNQIASFARNASNSAANAQASSNASSASNNRGRISSSASSTANKPASSSAPSTASRPNSAARPSASSGRIGASNPMRRLAGGGIARAGMEGFGYFEPNRNYNEAIIPLKADTLRSLGLGNSATVQQTNNFYGVDGAADATAQLEAVTRKVIYKVFQGMP